ncbi:MAG TPA: hypothetical protein VFF73_38375 [Planctomycetota bacterium]|nr:hypothetical protein [Planctomycetota bacterium]
MAGTVIISEEESWLKSGWCHSTALLAIRDKVAMPFPELARFLEKGCFPNWEFLDLRELEPDAFRALTRAARPALAALEAQGPGGFRDPRFFAGFIGAFRELCDLLEADPRAKA